MPPATRKIPYEELAKYFHLPLTDASEKLGICTTVLKRICRQYHLNRWPYRKIKSIDHTVNALKDAEVLTQTGVNGTYSKRSRGKLNVEQEIIKLEDRKIKLLNNPTVVTAETCKEQDRDRRKIMKKLTKRLKLQNVKSEISDESDQKVTQIELEDNTLCSTDAHTIFTPIVFTPVYWTFTQTPPTQNEGISLSTQLPALTESEIADYMESKLPILEPSFEKVQYCASHSHFMEQ